MTKFVELSHPIEDGMRAYPGYPTPNVGAFISRENSRRRYEGKAEFYIGKVEMVGNVGTYLDAPFHRHADGTNLSRIPLESIASLEGLVLYGKNIIQPRHIARLHRSRFARSCRPRQDGVG